MIIGGGGAAQWDEVMRPSWQEMHGLVPYIFRGPTRLRPAPALLFRIAIDWIMSMCADKAGVKIRQSLFTDIDYADNAVLAEDDVQWPSIFESFDTAANTMGLYTSWQRLKFKSRLRIFTTFMSKNRIGVPADSAQTCPLYTAIAPDSPALPSLGRVS